MRAADCIIRNFHLAVRTNSGLFCRLRFLGFFAEFLKLVNELDHKEDYKCDNEKVDY